MPGSPREAVLAQPQLEREQGEDPLAEAAPAHQSAGAAPAVAERSEPAVHERTVQHGARAGIPVKQEVVQGAMETARHHHVERNAESLFGATARGSQRRPRARSTRLPTRAPVLSRWGSETPSATTSSSSMGTRTSMLARMLIMSTLRSMSEGRLTLKQRSVRRRDSSSRSVGRLGPAVSKWRYTGASPARPSGPTSSSFCGSLR